MKGKCFQAAAAIICAATLHVPSLLAQTWPAGASGARGSMPRAAAAAANNRTFTYIEAASRPMLEVRKGQTVEVPLRGIGLEAIESVRATANDRLVPGVQVELAPVKNGERRMRIHVSQQAPSGQEMDIAFRGAARGPLPAPIRLRVAPDIQYGRAQLAAPDTGGREYSSGAERGMPIGGVEIGETGALAAGGTIITLR